MQRIFMLCLLCAGLGTGQAQTLAPTQTYSNIAFSLSTALAGYTSCNELRVDASGDFVGSTKFALYGVLNCPSTATGYTLAGSGYIGSDGSINMAFFMSNGVALQCPRLVGLAGNCSFHNAAGLQVGTAAIALK